MSGPYKMKGSPMYRNFGVGSPVKKLDVLIDGESIGTGDAAYAAGRVAEKRKSDAWAKGMAGTEGERKSDAEQELQKTKTTTIEYTGDDAYRRINDSDMSTKDKLKAKAEVRDGKSYSA